MERVLYGYDLHDLRPVDAMKKIPPRPALLIYGLLELPLDSDRRPQLKAALDAELWVVPDAIHTSSYTRSHSRTSLKSVRSSRETCSSVGSF